MKRCAKFILPGFLFLTSIAALATDPLAGLPDSIANHHKVLIQEGTCKADLNFSSEKHLLRAGNSLYFVPCWSGAYQESARGYIVNENSTLVTEVSILGYDETTKKVVPGLELTEVSYDEESGTISTETKERGLGDCGQMSESQIVWTSDIDFIVKPTLVRAKAKCDGKLPPFPIVFKQ